MQNFARELIQARKNKGMTQEQLAAEIHASRSAIGHWESGRSLPDPEMIASISKVLECNFLDKELLNDAEVMSAVLAAYETKNKFHLTKDRVIAFLAGFLLAAAIAAVLFLCCTEKTPDAAQSPEVFPAYSLAWYQQETAPEAGKSYVKITPLQNPTLAIRTADFSDGIGWFYGFNVQEINGLPFTVKEIVMATFGLEGESHPSAFPADIVTSIWGTNVLKDGASYLWNGGMPLQDVAGVGMLIKGTDAQGNEMEFRGYLALSMEIAEEAP